MRELHDRLFGSRDQLWKNRRIFTPAYTVKKIPTKAEIRAQLEKDVSQYLNKGGEIHQIPSGTSGREEASGPSKFSTPLFNTPKTGHTLVPDVVANIESRRRKKPEHKSLKAVRKKPQLKTIYDDFGEPVRKVWIEE